MENEYHSDATSFNHSTDYHSDGWVPFVLHDHVSKPVFYLLQIFTPIAIFGGIVANVFALAVIVRGRHWLKHEGYVYLGAAFCANVGVLTFCSSSVWLISLSIRYFPPNTSEFMCKFWYFMENIFFASGWLSVALLFSVYLREHLIHRRRCGCPKFAAKYCTLFASKVIVAGVFSAVSIFALPYLAFAHMDLPQLVCIVTESYNNRALLVELCLMWGLPLVAYLVLILALLCTSREGPVFGFSQFAERSDSDERWRSLAAILSSTIFFSQFVFFVPYHVFQHFSVTYEAFAGLAYALSTALQPVPCFLILTELRQGFRSQLRKIRCCVRLCPSLDGDEDAVQLTAIVEDPPSAAES